MFIYRTGELATLIKFGHASFGSREPMHARSRSTLCSGALTTITRFRCMGTRGAARGLLPCGHAALLGRRGRAEVVEGRRRHHLDHLERRRRSAKTPMEVSPALRTGRAVAVSCGATTPPAERCSSPVSHHMVRYALHVMSQWLAGTTIPYIPVTATASEKIPLPWISRWG